MRFLSLLIVGLLAVPPGNVLAQEAPLVPPEAARQGEDKAQEAAAPELSFRDPFRSFLPYDVAQQNGVEGSALGEDAQASIPKEEILDLSQFSVAGLVWGIEEARAIINGEIVAVGDTIGEAQVLRIDRDGILFGFHGREYLLKRNL